MEDTKLRSQAEIDKEYTHFAALIGDAVVKGVMMVLKGIELCKEKPAPVEAPGLPVIEAATEGSAA